MHCNKTDFSGKNPVLSTATILQSNVRIAWTPHPKKEIRDWEI